MWVGALGGEPLACFLGFLVHFACFGRWDQLSTQVKSGEIEGEIALSVPEFPSLVAGNHYPHPKELGPVYTCTPWHACMGGRVHKVTGMPTHAHGLHKPMKGTKVCVCPYHHAQHLAQATYPMSWCCSPWRPHASMDSGPILARSEQPPHQLGSRA